MRNGIAISSMLHVGVVFATIYGLPELLDPMDVSEQPIIVELVTIAERTVSQKPIEPEQKKAPPPAPLLKPIAAPEPEPEPEPTPAKIPPPPPEPVKVEAPPPPEPVKIAAPPPPEPVKPTQKPKPGEVVTPKPPEPEKPKEKPKPVKKLAMAEPAKTFRTLPRPRAKPKRRRPRFDPDHIAALLDKDDEKKPRQRREAAKSRKADKQPAPARKVARSQAPSVPMTMSEIDAIRYQIQQCWSIPAGARDAENLVVRIKVFLNSDGSLSRAPEIVSGDGAGDPFYRTAAESARRAVLKCSPLKNLPADKYARWREITLTFNPRDMLGG
ncbi:MAG: hypothetical protein HN478_08110 [Rhodospirillaceae bacterium]|nr:hypothetical protein [Rhodospirillaceae bacterium]